ncbi:MAG TPA: ACT domain-containing protein [Gammaproteobacteria bacterium]
MLTLKLLVGRYTVCKLEPDAAVPSTLTLGAQEFLSITRTADELSVVCPEALVPKDAKAEHGWRAFKVQGPLDFSLTGIIAALTAPLAEAKISVFTVATFDTDYLLVREKDLEGAISALEKISRVQC